MPTSSLQIPACVYGEGARLVGLRQRRTVKYTVECRGILAGKLDVRSRLSWARVWNDPWRKCHASVIRRLRGDLYPALPESPGFSCERGRKDENSWC